MIRRIAAAWPPRMPWLLFALLAPWGFASADGLHLEEVASGRPFLRRERGPYRNFALQNFQNAPHHFFPYTDIPKGRYDSFGNFLVRGYDLYKWDEIRTPGQKFGSAMFKQNPGAWNAAFDYVVAGSDGYGQWGYHFIVGDGLIARFTPLTLYKVDFNGARFDLATPHLKLTAVASRAERPMDMARDLRQASEAVQEVQLVVNGEVRSDLPPRVLSQRADGERELVFLFYLGSEAAIRSVAVEALVGNDYHVDVAMVYLKSDFATFYPDRFAASYFHVLSRAEGNVQDLSNLRRRRFDVGENTGHFIYSADLNLQLPGLELSAEYARSSVYSRYPAEIDNQPAFDDAPRFAHRGSAYFLNAVHHFGRGLAGAGLFSVNPGFSTEFRSYKHWENTFWRGHLQGLLNNYMYWRTVDDNGDRYPDIRHGALVGFTEFGRPL